MPLKDFRASIQGVYGQRAFKLYFYEDENSLIQENCQKVDEQTFPGQLFKFIASHGSSTPGPIFFMSPGTESPKSKARLSWDLIEKSPIEKKSDSASCTTTDTKEFSKQVHTRDGYRCCFCGVFKIHGATLHADHIIEKRRNADDDIDALLKDFHLTSIHSPTNGLTLCGHCHYLRGNGAIWTNSETMKVEGDVTLLKTETQKQYLAHAVKVIDLPILKPNDSFYEMLFPTFALNYRVRGATSSGKIVETKREHSSDEEDKTSKKTDKKQKAKKSSTRR